MAAVSIFEGMSPADLQAQLTALQSVYLQLAGGMSVASAGYTQGDGAKNVTFRRTDMATVAITIKQLQQALGIETRARRPIKPYF
ncbi:MAG: hypothetical protein ACXU82_03890 [Caulobacteraceae bacterium]